MKNFSFSCQRCGNCCRDRNIWINPKQARRIAHQIGLTLEEADQQKFQSCFEEKTEFGTILSHKARKMRLVDRNCPFLDHWDNSRTICQIYSSRPSICRCFPFSYSILVANQLVLVLPAVNSRGTLSCRGFESPRSPKTSESAFDSASGLVDEIIEDIRIALAITDLKDRLGIN
ncbi:MAG: YkgJ family cysteine cluster protein [Candidatus Heimdallarchaeota archaeon]